MSNLRTSVGALLILKKLNIESKSMIVTKEQLELLKKHGFMWRKNRSTDRVEEQYIQDILPAAHGLTVVYNEKAVIELSTAVVESIEFPSDLNHQWIFVNWESIKDQMRQ